MKHPYGKLLLPSLLVFVLITLVFQLAAGFFDKLGISHRVVILGNWLLYTLSAFTAWMHIQAIKNPNPHVFSRSVLGGTAIKLFALGIAMVVYLLMAGNNKSIFAIFTIMLLYVIYTVLDVRAALLLNKKD
ncbi:hypothetical protein [Parasediminibacterium sp. JCM 36343]|uniref:hypothetical protein n=1 Tax=Parasediminibacterium sp. JCM 36343 TaxID=3374279 RepID=UPI00397959DB